ncbi:helix-turn-helix domain-containing protein [Enterococcus sp. DIV1298c]|uniref:Transcriptional antiterminator n=1 Tax=Candidatus Enterococcus mangumiae TaxID=2230878 RepID=A0ABZ2T3F4_9ENTE|nr:MULTISPECIES: helix-turn-helix domain-containing protein [unclassified Enterococcus]MBO0462111.1 helix-turn-helix domain-containing protein [Enterococcus sp. DIV1298c]MBO0490591.1 helix-turn-helix domain-containing protein [Enterococcus sp. DIV1094]
MKGILNKQSTRQLALLELLWENEWLTVSEIVQVIGGVEKTIRTDIKHLNEIIKPLKIETSFKHGVFLDKTLGVSKTHLYSLFLQNCIECQIIEEIFIHPNLTKGELCDRLFISETQLNRLLTKLNSVLDKFSIQISHELKIEGSEINIRKLFASLMYEKYLSAENLLLKEEFKLIDRLIQRFYEENATIIEMNDQHHFLLNKIHLKVLAALYRCRQGEFIEKKATVFNYQTILDDDGLKQKCQECFEIELNEDILYNLFANYCEPFKVTKTCHQLGIEQSSLHNQMEQLIKDLSQRFNIECGHIDTLISDILWSSFRIIGPTFILNNVIEEFVLELMSENQTIMFELKESFAAIYEDLDLKPFDKKNMVYQSIYSLVTQWSDFRIEMKKTHRIKAALILDVPIGHLRMLKEEIEMHFRSAYSVDILSPFDQFSQAKLEKYDCVLTDIFTIRGAIEQSRVIGIPHYFDNEFINKLHTFIIKRKESIQLFRKELVI